VALLNHANIAPQVKISGIESYMRQVYIAHSPRSTALHIYGMIECVVNYN